ncbi:MAG TPA: SDR family NAD(P)-dependent oxidoreductase [Polyangiaceae bacterium]
MPSRTAVVTGGTRGLGRALSLRLASEGYHVVAVYHADEGASSDLLEAWRTSGLDGVCVRRDLRSTSPLELPLPPGQEEIVLVHNAAASFHPKPVHLVTADDYEAQWEVAVMGFARCLDALLRPMMLAKRSTIVTVGSRALAGDPPRGFGAYAAAKAALASLTRSVAVEYGPRGIRVFSVSPGFMRTSLTDAWDPSLRDTVARTGQSEPDAVARAIARLIGDPTLPARGESHEV